MAYKKLGIKRIKKKPGKTATTKRVRYDQPSRKKNPKMFTGKKPRKSGYHPS